MKKQGHAERLVALLSQGNPPDEVPDGFYTAREIATMLGRSIPTTNARIRKMLESGGLAVRKFSIRNESGATKPVPHYYIP